VLLLQIGRDRQSHCDVFVEVNNLITCEKFALKAFIGLAANQYVITYSMLCKYVEIFP